jgi:hypothetical protein
LPFDKLRMIGMHPFGLGRSKPFDKPRSFDRLTMHGPFDKLRANGSW